MTNAFIERTADGGFLVDLIGKAPLGPFKSEQAAIQSARKAGYTPLLAVPARSEEKTPLQEPDAALTSGYHPWVGGRYINAWEWPGVRLLLLGHSHYKDEKSDATCRWTRAYIDGARGPGTGMWRGLLRTVRGDDAPLDTQSRTTFFDQVAFANYIQVPLAKAGIPVADWQWETGREPFYKLLKELDPTHVLVFGSGVWDHLPPEHSVQVEDAFLFENEPWQVWTYPTPSGAAIATWVNHPAARGFSPRKWHPVATALLRLR